MKLNIGCDRSFLRNRGWVDTDLVAHASHVRIFDARRRWPFADGSAEFVYSGHLLEHMTYPEGQSFLGEAYRVLGKGGRLRLTTPNLQTFARMLLEPHSKEYRPYLDYQRKFVLRATPCFVVNLFLRAWGHTFLYDPSTLSEALSEAGFLDVTWHRCGESDQLELVGLEPVDRMPDGFYQLESMTAEAIK